MAQVKERRLGYFIWKSISFAWRVERKLLLLMIILSIILAAVVYLQLASFSKIVDEIIFMKQNGLRITDNLIKYSGLLGLSYLIPSALTSIMTAIQTKFRTRFGTHIDMWRIESFANLDIATAESTEFQNRLQSATQWGIGSINNVVNLSVGIVRDVTGVITSAVILWIIEPWLVLLATISALPIYFVHKKYAIKIYRLWHLGTDDTRIGANRRQHFQQPSLLVEVLLFNLKNIFSRQIKSINDKFDKEVIMLSNKHQWMQFFVHLLYVVTLGIAVFLVTKQTLIGLLPVGSLLLAFNTYRGFSQTVEGFFVNLSQTEEQARYAKRWYDLFSLESHIKSNPKAVVPTWANPPIIEFKNVSFKYPDQEKYVLKDINMKIMPGEKIAIVGENGAGKTTLIRLLSRVYDPSEGEILINGVNLREIDLSYWRSVMSVLFQDFANYNMKVAEAIAISKPDEEIDQERMLKAADLSGSDTFIQEFPKKYDQLLWKGFQDGVALSKGQYQRLAVARVLYRDTPIMILDEPTAAIDAVTEEKIFEVLEKKLEGKTVILISHRFSTVKNADRIFVVEHGSIVEQGSHKELMEKGGRYSELYTMQASRYLENK